MEAAPSSTPVDTAQTRAQRRAAIDADVAAWEARIHAPDGYATRLRDRRILAAILAADVELEDTAEIERGSGSIPGALPMPSPYATAPTPAIAARIEAPAVVLSRREVAGVGLAGMAASIATAGLLGLLGALLDLVLR